MGQAKIVHDHQGLDFSPSPNEEIFFKATGDETENRFDYFDLRVGHLEGFPVHIHLEQDETFHIVDGELILLLGDEYVIGREGDFIFIPKGVVHTYINARRSKPAHSIGIISPGGFHKFVGEMISLVKAAHGAPDMKKVDEICARYKQKNTAPPLATILGLRPDPVKAAAITAEMDKLDGDWTLVASEGRGQKSSPEIQKKHPGVTSIDGNRVRLFVKDMHDLEGIGKFDPTQNPKTLDYLHLNGPDKGKTGLAIYEVDGDTLRICWAITGLREGRPTEFSNRAGENQAILTYQRQRTTAAGETGHDGHAEESHEMEREAVLT